MDRQPWFQQIRNFDAGITDARNGKLTLTLLINP
jgi:hypothetical protein